MENKDKIKLTKILFELKNLDIKTAYINFNGGGDDGDVDDIEFENYNREISKPKINHWTEIEEPSDDVMKDIRDWAYDVIDNYVSDEYGGDWVNNDGGYGSIVLDIENETYALNYSQRTTEDMSWHIDIADD
tara:strand:+ start:49 stop:444 length:396 start_codon:yes stop_codon:yes gene_type:complete